MLPIRGGRKRRRSLRAAQKIEIAEEAAAKAADTTTCSLVPHKSLYLFLAHNPRLCKDSYSLCKINLNDLQYDHEPRDLSPVLELEGNGVYPRGMGCALLHSKLYILGGELLPNLKKPKHDEREIFPRHVYQVDTTKSNHSIEKMEMELNTGKPGPCVFAADAKIYALGTKFCPNLPSDKRFNIRKLASRIKLFECFDPNTNRWKVLDNPPVDEFIHWKGCNVLERRRQVLVIGREGRSSMVVLLYHLDQKKWTRYDHTHNPFTTSMIYMALSSQEADSSHHLYGISSHAPVKSDLDIHIPSCTYEDNRLVQLSSVDKSIDIFMATPYIHLTERLLRYLGDHHFCYINYGMLPDPNGPDSYGDTMFDLCSLGITITLFKEVSHDDDDNIDGNSTYKSGGEQLRHSFQAKILHCQQYLMKSPLPNMATLVECFVVSPEPKAAAPVMKASATSKLVGSLNPSTILYQ